MNQINADNAIEFAHAFQALELARQLKREAEVKLEMAKRRFREAEINLSLPCSASELDERLM
jgi:hypothetical protein